MPGWLSSTNSQLIASSPISNIQKPRRRCGGVGLCSSGIPRPSGAGATRQPCLSRGIGAGGTALSEVSEAREAGSDSAMSAFWRLAHLGGRERVAKDAQYVLSGLGRQIVVGHPVGPGREQLVDVGEQGLVVLGRAHVLALVLLPRADQERLEVAARGWRCR